MKIWKHHLTISPFIHALTDGKSSTCLTLNSDIIKSQSLVLYNNSNTDLSSIEMIINGNNLYEEIYECSGPAPLFLVGFSINTLGEGQCQPFCEQMFPCNDVQISSPRGTYHVICECPLGLCNKIALYVPYDRLIAVDVQFCSATVAELIKH